MRFDLHLHVVHLYFLPFQLLLIGTDTQTVNFFCEVVELPAGCGQFLQFRTHLYEYRLIRIIGFQPFRKQAERAQYLFLGVGHGQYDSA